MTTFLKNIGSNHILENRQFKFSAKTPYDLVAEVRQPADEANPVDWTFTRWCAILKIVRTHFAAEGREEIPPRNPETEAPPR